MEIAGIDFGTTYVSISTWDPDNPDAGLPQSRMIGRGGTPTMPATVAFKRQSNGSVSMVIGEDADALIGGTHIVVIRDIKRWAQASESISSYVKWRLDSSGAELPSWWIPPDQEANEPGHVEVWGKTFYFKEIIAAILKEAINRAAIPAEFEWRTGCPVHAGHEYRSWLGEALTEIAGNGSLKWVIDEPVLFLTLAMQLGSDTLRTGSYIVYDLGGGSFDCALVEVQDRLEQDQREMVVYGADGNPWLGGADSDLALEKLFQSRGHEVPVNLLRLAKERVSPDYPVEQVTADFDLRWTDVEEALKAEKFIQRSLMAMRDAYISAKAVVWRRDEWGDDPDHLVLDQDNETGEVRFVWQVNYEDMVQDLDGIMLFGGTTLSPFFTEKLRPLFGQDKVMRASEIIPGTADAPELVGLSMGACYYSSRERYSHRLQNRLPYWVTLENRQTGRDVKYRPYQYFTNTFQPAEQFESPWLLQERDNPHEYELTIIDPDGVVLERVSVDGYLEPENRQPATSLRLVIDRLGPVYVEKRSEGVGLPWTKRITVVEHPPWQSEEQREMLDALRQRQRQRESIRRAQAGHQLSQMETHPEP